MKVLNNLFRFSGGTLSFGSFSVTFTLSGIIEILLLSVLCYYLIILIKRTKAWTLLKGVAMLLIIYAVSKLAGLNTIAYIFETSVGSIIIAAIVIFQPELRKLLEKLGERSIFEGMLNSSPKTTGLNPEEIDAITRALTVLGRNKTGALIVIERNIDLGDFISSGIRLDATISSELLEQIFEHNTPLHDGAVVIRENRITAATCYLPLSGSQNVSKELGTRHRAALGMAEATDALILVASEETGRLSAAFDGELHHNVTPDQIRDILIGLGETEGDTDKKQGGFSFHLPRREMRRHE